MILSNTIADNKLAGILVLDASQTQIGAAGRGNVINRNQTDGVAIFLGGANRVQGNIIGTDGATATQALGNRGDGVHVVASSGNMIGGLTPGESNIISANEQSGVEIFGNSNANSVLGNTIGTTALDTQLGNKLNGVLISGSPAQGAAASTNPTDNFIGSLPSGEVASNVIAGNQLNGVAIILADRNVIRGNQIGLGSGLGNKVDGVSVSAANGTVIGGADQAVGGAVYRLGNTIASNGLDGIGILNASGTAIAGNTVLASAGVGVALQNAVQTTLDANAIQGSTGDGINLLNAIETILVGNLVSGNRADGIRLQEGSNRNRIGLPFAAPNVVIENAGAGIEISTRSTDNAISNNRIGYTGGPISRGNLYGVLLNSVSGNLIGNGASLDAGANTITGNRIAGVYVLGNDAGAGSPGNTIQFNFIGTNPEGNAPDSFPGQGNGRDVGITVANSTDNAILGNVVSGNRQAGIELLGRTTTRNQIQGNTIGSDRSQLRPILTDPAAGGAYSTTSAVGPRQAFGIWIREAAGNIIGSAFAPNVIQANGTGIEIQEATAQANQIKFNFIGTHPGATLTPGNNTDGLGNFFGILADNTAANQFSNNTIAHNLSVGIALVGAGATDNLVFSNTVSSNGGYGIFDAGLGLITPIDYTTAIAATRTRPGSVRLFGSGIYVEGGSRNIIGSRPSRTKGVKELPGDGNVVEDNTQVGIYIFNAGPATTNTIRSNRIRGVNYTGRGGPFNGDYGILLYNSSGNLSSPKGTTGTSLQGRFSNKIGGTRIARFREYTGPGSLIGSVLGPVLGPGRPEGETGHGPDRRRVAPVRARPPGLNRAEGTESARDHRGRRLPASSLAEVVVEQDAPLDRERPGAGHRDNHTHRQH